ncbi:hypothetical protein [Parafrankia discariae]|uniref:hypothetical protein n=1 Tax=Parafrankia discariae TaxID=365528 RepID=UPI00035F8524|nr:hypothetical protein [Parafrankia discariae]
MHRAQARTVAALASGVLVLALTAACGGGDDTAAAPAASRPAAATTAPWTGAPSAGATATAGVSSAPAATGTTVMVTATEFALKLSQDTFTAGTYTFVTTNDGQVTHALEIEGPGLGDSETADLGPGQSEGLTVTLGLGTYKLYCPVGNHEAQGMSTQITVT